MSRGLNTEDDVPQLESHVGVAGRTLTAEENSVSSDYFTCVSSPSKLPRGDEGFNNNREYAPQPVSCVEVTAHNQRAGVNSSSEYFTCVSPRSKLPRGDEVFHQLHRNVSSLGTLKEFVSQLIRKRKRMKGHPGEFYNNPVYAPQPVSRVEVPANNQRAGVNSSSEYFSCVSPRSKLPRGDEVFHQLHRNVSSLGTLKEFVSQLIRKRKRMEGHPEEFYNNPVYAPQPVSRVEVPANNQRAGVNSSSEYFSCVSPRSKLPRGDEVFHQLHRNVSSLGTLKEFVSQLIRKRKRMEGHPEEMNRRPLPQDLDQSKISSSSSQASRPSYPSDDDNPSMSSALAEDERVMTIYYMYVQMKGGVAVLCNTEEGFKPPSKKIKMQKMTYIEKVHKNIPCSHTSVKKFPTDGEPSLNSRTQEKWNSTSSPYSRAQPPTLVEYSRVSRPEWLLAAKSGFRCMACFWFFPSLEVLREHVEHGVNEGFSCHTFHLTLACLKCQEPKEETEKATFRSQMATYFGLN